MLDLFVLVRGYLSQIQHSIVENHHPAPVGVSCPMSAKVDDVTNHMRFGRVRAANRVGTSANRMLPATVGVSDTAATTAIAAGGGDGIAEEGGAGGQALGIALGVMTACWGGVYILNAKSARNK